MREDAGSGRILTPEELKDLLKGQVHSARDRDGELLARRLPRSGGADDAQTKDGSRQLRRAVEDCATQWGRRMASSYQRRIECSLIGWDEFETEDIAPTFLDTDEVVCFSLSPETGFVFLGRPLFFALLSLEFGAGSAASSTVGPLRPYSGIERRLLTRLARDLLGILENFWRPWCGLRPEVTGLATRDGVLERVSHKIMLASLDVTALGTVGRVRIGIPLDAFAESRTAPAQPSARDAVQLQRGVADVPVTLRAELGSTQMTLSQLANLRVADVIPVRPSAPQGLLIRLEGRPKFRAVAGSVGSRLAAEVVDLV